VDQDKQDSCDLFFRWILEKLDFRWQGYKKVRGQVCKRIKRRIKELGLSGYHDYRFYLLNNPGEWKVADRMMRITISRFFRDKKTWEAIGDKLLPSLIRNNLADHPTIRCWSAGCASGEEPFSFAILWREKILPAFPRASLELLATDADPGMLTRAKIACYKRGSLRELPPAWGEKAFCRKDSVFCLAEKYREMVRFELQDIRELMPEGEFDLVFCKNLAAMYFNKELATAIFKKIGQRMRHGAFLILGNHEEFPVNEVKEIKEFNKGLKLYRKD
jgi:chemotaxis protein methyltransferase CheR